MVFFKDGPKAKNVKLHAQNHTARAKLTWMPIHAKPQATLALYRCAKQGGTRPGGTTKNQYVKTLTTMLETLGTVVSRGKNKHV